jgi:hypothetical protein
MHGYAYNPMHFDVSHYIPATSMSSFADVDFTDLI